MKLVSKFCNKSTDEVKAQIFFLEDKDLEGMIIPGFIPPRYLVVDFEIEYDHITDYKSYYAKAVVDGKVCHFCSSINDAKQYLISMTSSTAVFNAKNILYGLMNNWHTADDSAQDLVKVQEMICNAFNELNVDYYFKEYQY